MIEWLWEGFYQAFRFFVVLSIITVVSIIVGVGYAWLQGAPDERNQ